MKQNRFLLEKTLCVSICAAKFDLQECDQRRLKRTLCAKALW